MKSERSMSGGNGVDTELSGESNDWVHLKLGKEFSRILYPNPVCLLATKLSPSNTKGFAGENDINNGQVGENVMVLSWLTPTNNQGRFMFSINKSRYSASLLAPPYDEGCKKRARSEIKINEEIMSTCNNETTSNYQTGVDFTLSIPIRGMEQVVLDVGSTSGRFGSKFPSKSKQRSAAIEEGNEINSMESMSNRQRKKIKKQQLMDHGVEGLVPIPLGNCTEPSSSLFAIKGTAAHLKCRTYAVIGNAAIEKAEGTAGCRNAHGDSCPAIIDDNHLLVLAEVTDGYVHQSYWDDKKLLFCPLSRDVPPYLTFFGSQTFGYVTTTEAVNENAL